METRHEQLQFDLPDYADGRLKGDALRVFEEHLRGCEGCRATAVTMKEFGEALRRGGRALLEPHPEAVVLQSYARGQAGPDRERIETHLETCASCALELSVWQGGREAGGREDASSGRWGAVAGPLAAGLLVGIGLGWFLGQQGRRPPATVEGISVDSAEPAGVEPRTGPLLLLPRALREGEQPDTTYHLDPFQSVVVIACPAVVPGAIPAEAPFRFELRGADGQMAWSRDIRAQAMREHLASPAEAVTLLVPAAALRPGRYTLTLAPLDNDGAPGAPLYQAGIVIEEP